MDHLKVTKFINAPAKKVWEGLTKPDLVKQYFFGTNVESTWEKGAEIFFRGEYEGKKYEDKGVIISVEPGKHVAYEYWSSLSGEPETPENYREVVYDLVEKDNGTEVTITQETTPEKREHSEQNWKKVLDGLQKTVEH
jgi:uncharacterized protein YndB with AHSA1/START domain